MVPVENRPENRFEVLMCLCKLSDKLIENLKNFSSAESNYALYAISNAKSYVRTYNSLNIYDNDLLKLRQENQVKAICELNKLKSIIECNILISKENHFGDSLSKIDEIIKKILRNQESDTIKNLKGKNQVKNEYLEAKYKQFYVQNNLNTHEVKKNELDANDPFGIKDLIFNK